MSKCAQEEERAGNRRSRGDHPHLRGILPVHFVEDMNKYLAIYNDIGC
jgi:hypothetical protein